MVLLLIPFPKPCQLVMVPVYGNLLAWFGVMFLLTGDGACVMGNLFDFGGISGLLKIYRFLLMPLEMSLLIFLTAKWLIFARLMVLGGGINLSNSSQILSFFRLWPYTLHLFLVVWILVFGPIQKQGS